MNEATNKPGRIRVVLADDQALVRGGLASLLDLEDDIDVVGEVGRGDELAALVVDKDADVALVDVEMPGLDGIEAVAAVNQTAPGCACLIVTTFGRPGYLRRALQAGAAGFVVKDTPATELAESVRRVHRGERVVDPALATESIFDGPNPLTDRECEVLRLALSGATNREIASQLRLSAGTVRNYLSTAIAKTGAATKVQAALFARDRGWL